MTTVSPLLATLLEHAAVTGAPLPDHPFSLAAYIRDSVGRHMNAEQQQMLFNEVTAYQLRHNNSANNTNKDGGASSGGKTATAAAVSSALSVEAVPVISVLDATTAQAGEAVIAADGGEDLCTIEVTAPAPVVDGGRADTALATATATNANNAIPTRTLFRKSLFPPVGGASSSTPAPETETQRHLLILGGGSSAITNSRRVSTLSASGQPPSRDASTAVAAASAIVNQQNALANPLAAIANTIAVDEKMRTISEALAITAAVPEAEAERFAARYGGGGGFSSSSPSSAQQFGSVAVSEADLAHVGSVGAYILIDENVRCPPPPEASASAVTDGLSSAGPIAVAFSPRMGAGLRYESQVPPEALFLLDKEDPFYLLETAEQLVERSDGCAGSAGWYAAAEQFEHAAQSFATLGFFRMAANCQVRQHDCFKATGRLSDAALSLIAASHYHTQEGLVDDSSAHRESNDAALACMQNAIGLYDEGGSDVTAAKLCAEAAELCVRARNAGLGVDILHVAAGTFEAAGQHSHAERCYARAAEIAILDMRDFAEAIDTLEKMARVTSLSRQHLAYFKAFICRFVCVPPEQGLPFVVALEDCQKTLELYETLCPSLAEAPDEYPLIGVIMGCQRKMEDERLEEAISKYLEANGSNLERWAELILRKIHENLVLRKSSVEKLYKL